MEMIFSPAGHSVASAVQYVPLSRIFLVFIAYGCIGWCAEVLYVGLFFEHKFVNRGFLRGPICPVYGCGGLAVLALPLEIKNSWGALFVSVMVLATTVEYLTAWYLEHTFHMKWWDYSHYRFNIQGRVCLLNSVLFGVLGVVIVRFVQPLIDFCISQLNDVLTLSLAGGIAVVFSIDLVTTTKRLVDFSTFMEKMQEFSESLKVRFADEAWFRSTTLADMFASVREHIRNNGDFARAPLMHKFEEFYKHHANHERLLRLFPEASSVNYKEALSLMRARIAESIAERKAARTTRRDKQ
ncbi:MAG: putative ABC transporter permease [Treponema sp.]|nr:putative ABC transporter permease [Treponema sp.]